MNEELKDIKGSFFTDRSCIEISYNILCNKVCSILYIFFVKKIKLKKRLSQINFEMAFFVYVKKSGKS